MTTKFDRMAWVQQFACIAELSLHAPSKYQQVLIAEERFRELHDVVSDDCPPSGKPIIINLLEDSDEGFSVRVITDKSDIEVNYVY